MPGRQQEVALSGDLKQHRQESALAAHGTADAIKAMMPTWVPVLSAIGPFTWDAGWHTYTISGGTGATLAFVSIEWVGSSEGDYAYLYFRKTGDSSAEAVWESDTRGAGTVVVLCSPAGKFDYMGAMLSGSVTIRLLGYIKFPGAT